MNEARPKLVDPSRPRLLLVDAANSIYRAFFALPPMRSPDGRPTHAALGFLNMLVKALREESPDHVAVVLDAPGPSFRSERFEGYKASRDAQPEDLSAQIPIVRELISALQIPLLEIPGVEADDVIATLVTQAPKEASVCILSTDKDLMQLVGDRVHLLDGMRDRTIGIAEVEERFGVPVEQLLDLRALAGDPSDDIPGVPGIGEKTAARLLAEWGSLDRLLAHAGEVTAKRAREALLAHADDARLSRELATLRRDVSLPLGFADLRRTAPDAARLRVLYQQLGFKRLLSALDAEKPTDAAAPAGTPIEIAQSAGDPATPAAAPDSIAVVARFDPPVRVIETEEALAELVRELANDPLLDLSLLPVDGGAMETSPVGLAIALGEEAAAFLPIGRHSLVSAPGLREDVVARALRPLLCGSQARRWAGVRCQRTLVVLGERGLELPAPCFDLEIAAFLLDPTAQRGVSSIAARMLGLGIDAFETIAGRGAKSRPASELPTETLARFAGAEVCLVRRARPVLAAMLAEQRLAPLFETVEMPLVGVLARMERKGLRIDESRLASLGTEIAVDLARIEDEIHRLAGTRFQISSPKQLQQILFERLKLPVVKKNKTGYSTDESVLEQLASQHPLPERILAHRRLAKLASTYIDALPPLVHPRTGRIHPTFLQTGAATGRLSCIHPNVQNIPIRSPEGARIREAFVPAEGARLLSADYSQVELRILAHFSGDASLIEAFQRGEDVHRRTWAEVSGKRPEDVTPEERARAKAVNFGIVYGSSAFGLSRQLGIAAAEAQATIDAYFDRYRGVRRFLDETIASARERGFVVTLLGRRRPLSDLGSRNRVLRQAAERMAVNTVVQGTAADLVKRAMVRVDDAMVRAGLRAQMILQVHDELVFELPPDEESALRALVDRWMREAPELRVPLEIEIGSGRNWREAH